MLADIRDTARRLRLRPGQTFATVITLGVAIGATVAVFAMIDPVLFRRLPYPRQERIVAVRVGSANVGLESYPRAADYSRFAGDSSNFEQVGTFFEAARGRVNGSAAAYRAVSVTPSFVDIFRVHAYLGRGFVDEDYESGSEPVCLVTDVLWRTVLQRRPDALGETLTVSGFDRRQWRVVGVLPPRFVFPDIDDEPPGIIVPVDIHSRLLTTPTNHTRVFGVLRPDRTVRATAAEAQMVARATEQEHPNIGPQRRLEVLRIRDALYGSATRGAVAMFLATGALLCLIATQLAWLFISRLESQRVEFGVRRALGATRARLVRLVLMEVSVLASAAGVAAILAAVTARSAVLLLLPNLEHVYRLDPTGFGPRLLAFDAAAVLFTIAIVGLVPTLRVAGRRFGTERVDCDRSRSTLVQGALVSQAGLSVVVLVISFLAIRSYVDLAWQRLGFDFDSLRIVQPELPLKEVVRDPTRWQATNREIVRQIRERFPNRVAASDGIPGMQMAGQLTVPDSTTSGRVPAYAATVEFQAIAGLRLTEGRWFTPMDVSSGARVAVIDRRGADLCWSGAAPVGKRLRSHDGTTFEVVGVIDTVRTDISTAAALGSVFVPLTGQEQALLLFSYRSKTGISLDAIRRIVTAVEPNAYVSAAPMRVFEYVLGGRRFLAGLLCALGAIAVAMVGAGNFFVVTAHVSSARRELAIREALGASRRRIHMLIARRMLLPVGIGVCAGAFVSIASSHVVRSLLIDQRTPDMRTLGAAAALVLASSLAALVVPLWRATRDSAWTALRHT